MGQSLNKNFVCCLPYYPIFLTFGLFLSEEVFMPRGHIKIEPSIRYKSCLSHNSETTEALQKDKA